MVSLRQLSRTPAVYVIPVKMPGRPRGRTVLVPVNQIVPLQELKHVRITTVELVQLHATQTAELTLQRCARHRLIKNNVGCSHCNVQSNEVKRGYGTSNALFPTYLLQEFMFLQQFARDEVFGGLRCVNWPFFVWKQKKYAILPKYLSLILKQCIWHVLIMCAMK